MKKKISWQTILTNKWFRFGVGLPTLAVGLYIGWLGWLTKNPVIIAIGFAIGGSGIVAILGGFQSAGTQHVKGDVVKNANCMNLYPDRIAFEYSDTPQGEDHLILNNNKRYYFQKHDGNGGFVPFILPDDDASEHYYDPGEFANPVTMPASKKYLNWSATPLQTVSVIVMVVVIVGELIALIAVPGRT